MIDKINSLKETISSLTASSEEQVEALRIKYLSKKGAVSQLFNDFRLVPADQKKAMGQALNELKNLATDKINSLREQLAVKDDIDEMQNDQSGQDLFSCGTYKTAETGRQEYPGKYADSLQELL